MKKTFFVLPIKLYKRFIFFWQFWLLLFEIRMDTLRIPWVYITTVSLQFYMQLYKKRSMKRMLTLANIVAVPLNISGQKVRNHFTSYSRQLQRFCFLMLILYWNYSDSWKACPLLAHVAQQEEVWHEVAHTRVHNSFFAEEQVTTLLTVFRTEHKAPVWLGFPIKTKINEENLEKKGGRSE